MASLRQCKAAVGAAGDVYKLHRQTYHSSADSTNKTFGQTGNINCTATTLEGRFPDGQLTTVSYSTQHASESTFTAVKLKQKSLYATDVNMLVRRMNGAGWGRSSVGISSKLSLYCPHTFLINPIPTPKLSKTQK